MGELPTLGLVKNSQTLRKYINTESYYEREYHFTSNFLPEVEGYIANMTVFYDDESPEKSFVVYRATWDQGEVSDMFKALMKGLIDAFDIHEFHMRWQPLHHKAVVHSIRESGRKCSLEDSHKLEVRTREGGSRGRRRGNFGKGDSEPW